MGLYDRDYMKRPWQRQDQESRKLPLLPNKKPLRYWIPRLIALLAGLELAFLISRFLK